MSAQGKIIRLTPTDPPDDFTLHSVMLPPEGGPVRISLVVQALKDDEWRDAKILDDPEEADYACLGSFLKWLRSQYPDMKFRGVKRTSSDMILKEGE